MSLPAPFTQTQLEIACGGAADLLKLADKTGESGELSSASCQAFIAEVQSAAAGEMYSILQVAFDPTDPNFPQADFVKQNAVTIGVYWAWHKSTGGLAVPPPVEQAKDKAIATLEKAKDGFRSLGTDVDVASNAGAKQVSIDDTGRRILRKNMGGYC